MDIKEPILTSFTKQLADGLENGSLQIIDARDACKAFVEFLDDPSIEKSKSVLTDLSGRWPIFRPTLIRALSLEEEKKISPKLEELQAHLQAGRIDEAINLAVGE